MGRAGGRGERERQSLHSFLSVLEWRSSLGPSMASSMQDFTPSSLLSVADATHIVLSIAKRLAPVSLPLHQALGLVLAEDLAAPDPLPPYPASIKDGYAVIANDGPGDYPVIAEARAGDDASNIVLTPGTVAYITTGGPVPNGADAVVQVEDTEQLGGNNGDKKVRILKQVSKGHDIRPVVCFEFFMYMSTKCLK